MLSTAICQQKIMHSVHTSTWTQQKTTEKVHSEANVNSSPNIEKMLFRTHDIRIFTISRSVWFL